MEKLKRVVGYVLMVMGSVLLPCSFFGIVWLIFRGLTYLIGLDSWFLTFLIVILCLASPLTFFLLMLLMDPVAGVVGAITDFGLGLATPRLDLAYLEKEPRIILYLRSFDDDHFSLWSPGWTLSGWRREEIRRNRPEWLLFRPLYEVGRFVALGGDELLRPVGASRVYVSDDKWQARIERLMQRAAIVVIHARRHSPGLDWEMGQIRRLVQPTKLMFFLGFHERGKSESRQAQYEQFKQNYEHVWPSPLPDQINNAYFLVFDADWRPRLIVPSKTNTLNERIDSALDVALEHVMPNMRSPGLKYPLPAHIAFHDSMTIVTVGILCVGMVGWIGYLAFKTWALAVYWVSQ